MQLSRKFSIYLLPIFSLCFTFCHTPGRIKDSQVYLYSTPILTVNLLLTKEGIRKVDIQASPFWYDERRTKPWFNLRSGQDLKLQLLVHGKRILEKTVEDPFIMWIENPNGPCTKEIAEEAEVSLALPITKELLDSTIEIIPLSKEAETHTKASKFSLRSNIIEACNRNLEMGECKAILQASAE